MTQPQPAAELNSLKFLLNPSLAPVDQFVYELTDPAADMQSTVRYVGVHPADRKKLTGEAYSNAVGLTLGADRQQATFLADLALSAILPTEEWSEHVQARTPELAGFRDEMALKFAVHSLAHYFSNIHIGEHVPVGAAPPGTIQDVYDQLGGRTTDPWTESQRRLLSVVLNEPGFNAVGILHSLGHHFDRIRFCIPGEPTILSVPPFVESLNQNTSVPAHTIANRLTIDSFRAKANFVRRIFKWFGGDPVAKEIFGPREEAQARYGPPASNSPSQPML